MLHANVVRAMYLFPSDGFSNGRFGLIRTEADGRPQGAEARFQALIAEAYIDELDALPLFCESII